MPYIIDAHQDIAYNALTFKRDIRLSAHQVRKNEMGTEIPVWNKGDATVGWPDFQSGQVAVIFTTLWMPPWRYRGGEWDIQAYQTTQQASVIYRQQLDYYRRLCDENPEMFKLILDRRDLAQVLAPFEDKTAQKNKPVGLVLLMEGAEGLSDPEELEEFYELGLRQVGPVWAGNRYCAGSKEDRPFDQEGRKLLEVMSSLGMALDISHMTERSALTALDLYDGAVMASHANARRLLKNTCGERHLTDPVIHKLMERGGVIGVVPYNLFLSPDWAPSSPSGTVTIDHLIAQIDYYCQMAGDSTHTGIGSDLDGGFGYPLIPMEMDTIADLQKMESILLKKGYTETDTVNIFSVNWKNHLENILPE
jgi:membrane dipeptidase